MNKIFYTILLLLFAVLGPVESTAINKPIGTWDYVAAFSPLQKKVIPTRSGMVYFLSGTSLFAYDTENDESHTYNHENILNDFDVDNIFYNKDKKYLLIAYDNGNIDLLYDDGHVDNISDIRDADNIDYHTILDVDFDAKNNRIYVAMPFGIVVIDDDKNEVIETGNYSKKVNALSVVGKNLVINIDKELFYIPLGRSIRLFNNFKQIASYFALKEIQAVGTDAVITVDDSNTIRYTELDLASGNISSNKVLMYYVPSYYFVNLASGKVKFIADNVLYSFNEEKKLLMICELPEEQKFDIFASSLKGDDDYWVLSHYGLSKYEITSDGDITVKMQAYIPEDFSVKKAFYFYPTLHNKFLFVQNVGYTGYKFGLSAERGRSEPQTAGRIDMNTGEAIDVTLYPVDTDLNVGKYWRNDKYLTGVTAMAPDSDHPEVYYVSSAEQGLMKVRNGELEGRFDDTNSPLIRYDNRYICYGCNVDRGGNVWMAMVSPGYSVEPIWVLPREKAALNPSQVKKEDWVKVPLGEKIDYYCTQDVVFLNCMKSNMIFILDSNVNNKLVAIDTRGTFNKLNDDIYYCWSDIYDQDGNKFTADRHLSLCEDNEGKVWWGTNQGIMLIEDPTKATSSSMRMTHIKVPRNDGSNLADYLLGSDFINSITVDAANRKWIATNDSGLYLVSSDGQEILEHFHSNNSPLPTNRINAVFVNPNTNTLYVGTKSGVYTYRTNVSRPSENYKDVYAFPNPVRPDYTGNIYVTGLIDNSLVKISDTSGTVLAQGTSEGGMFTWDGCNLKGRRVPTGVYYAYVSNPETSEGTVLKIMVVK